MNTTDRNEQIPSSEFERIMQKYQCAPHQVVDYRTRESNLAMGNKLCKRCDGTGNELFSMYRKCQHCNGTGVKSKMKKTDIEKFMMQFVLDYQWELFLQRCQIKEEDLPPDQRREMKRAFMGGVGQTLVLMRDELTRLEDDDAARVLEDMLFQVGEFWQKEMDEQNGGRP